MPRKGHAKDMSQTLQTFGDDEGRYGLYDLGDMHMLEISV
jgi:hypothetical protein